MPITSIPSNFKGETQGYLVKLPKPAGAGQYCPKIPRVPGTLGTRANSSPGVHKYLPAHLFLSEISGIYTGCVITLSIVALAPFAQLMPCRAHDNS